MSYETLMVQLELGRSNAAPLAVTRALARRMGSVVTGIAAAQPIQALVMAEGFYPGDLVREDSDGIDQEAHKAHEEFLQAMDDHAVGLDWKMTVTRHPLSDHIASQTGTADLLVVGVDHAGGGSSSSGRRVDVDDMIMQTGRPVMVVPPKVREFHFRCALIAWKECREARRALVDALPLLKQMSMVVISEVASADQQGAVQADLSRMVAWLSRHGIFATVRLILAGGSDSDRLLDLADEIGADLIVAGAYGHSRLREWVLGGVTRDLLHKSQACLLLSH